jgi:hypothetical protein
MLGNGCLSQESFAILSSLKLCLLYYCRYVEILKKKFASISLKEHVVLHSDRRVPLELSTSELTLKFNG